MEISFKRAKTTLAWSLTSTREDIIGWFTNFLGQPTLESDRNYWVWRGEHPLALVSHIDTVPEMRTKGAPPDLRIDNNILFSVDRVGLGADDRAGIAALMSAVYSGYRPTIIICDGEERGCLGAQELVKNYPKMPWDISAMIENDRRGDNDVVYYGMDINEGGAPQLRDLIEGTGKFKLNWGTCSDISVIAPAWKVAAANVSAGYYNEHTSVERLNVDEWRSSAKRLQNILDASSNLPLLAYEAKKYKALHSYDDWEGASSSTKQLARIPWYETAAWKSYRAKEPDKAAMYERNNKADTTSYTAYLPTNGKVKCNLSIGDAYELSALGWLVNEEVGGCVVVSHENRLSSDELAKRYKASIGSRVQMVANAE